MTRASCQHDDSESPSYYTGMRFWVYGADRRRAIAQGGRYDSLYEQFGAAAPAIGFTFTIDEIGTPASSPAERAASRRPGDDLE